MSAGCEKIRDAAPSEVDDRRAKRGTIALAVGVVALGRERMSGA